jgi:hypothetical protein
MSDSCGSSGIFARVAYDATDPGAFANFVTLSKAFPLAGGGTSLSINQPHVNNEGLSGQTTQSSELTRTGLIICDGDLPLLATPEALDIFLPHITGRALSSGVTYPAVEVPSRFHLLLHRDALLYPYFDLVVNQAVIGGSAGEPINLNLSLLGKSRDATLRDPSLWPAGLYTSKSVPYMFSDLDITVGGVAYPLRSFQLTYNNNLTPAYFDSNTPCGFRRAGPTVTTLQLVFPHTSAIVAAVQNGAVPPAGLDVIITMTHPTAGMSFIIRCQSLQIPPKDAAVAEGEIMLDLTGTARTKSGGSSGGAEVIFTNDSTPS